MQFRVRFPALPPHMWLLIAVYSAASFAHFAHNAEFIAFYPNMPVWITRETVYRAWLAIAAVGVVGVIFLAMSWRIAGVLALAAYGALGLDGLGHYALALCAEHTLAANLTIWLEVAAGSALAAASIYLLAVETSRRRMRTLS